MELIKLLKPFTRNAIIRAIWGEKLKEKELSAHRIKMVRRFRTGNFTDLEIEKIKIFLQKQEQEIFKFLKN